MLIVFGRGLDREEGGVVLSRASAARVRAAVDYVRGHLDLFSAPGGTPKKIVFGGGWAEAADGMTAPPVGSREGDLMLDLALREPVGAGRLDDYAEVCVEAESRSTLENLLNVVRLGYVDLAAVTPSNPLGLVGHRGHLKRIAYLAMKGIGGGPRRGSEDPRRGPGRRFRQDPRVGLVRRDPTAIRRRAGAGVPAASRAFGDASRRALTRRGR
jgi:hypothetical protein